jgi:hypothetical protein
MRWLLSVSLVLLGCGGIAAQGAEPLHAVVDLVHEDQDTRGVTLHHDHDARNAGASVDVHDLGPGCRGETSRRPTWALFVPARPLRLTVQSEVPGAGLVVRLADGDVVCDVAGVVEVDAPLGGLDVWATTPSMLDHPSFELTVELLSDE